MSLNKDDWRMGYTEDTPRYGCGCLLLLIVSCLAIDALAVLAIISVIRLVTGS